MLSRLIPLHTPTEDEKKDEDEDEGEGDSWELLGRGVGGMWRKPLKSADPTDPVGISACGPRVNLLSEGLMLRSSEGAVVRGSLRGTGGGPQTLARTSPRHPLFPGDHRRVRVKRKELWLGGV